MIRVFGVTFIAGELRKSDSCLVRIEKLMTIDRTGQSQDWLLATDELQVMIADFLDVFAKRPVVDNQGGVSSVGAFSLWYFLKRHQPQLVVESGVWKGQTTWLIEQALPDVTILCFDPYRKIREYESPNAAYPKGDFAKYDFPTFDPEKTLVFFDDHQDAVKRVVHARRKGFRHVVFDDNYAVGSGAHRSVAHALADNDKTTNYLNTVIEAYQIFPPMFPYDEPITGEKVPIGIPPLDLPDDEGYQLFKDDMASYRWMTYVKLNAHPKLSLGMHVFEWMNRRL